MKTKKSNLIDELIKSGEITIDSSLDKYDNEIVFKEKVKKGRETIAKIGMPKAYYEQYGKKES